MIKLLRHNCWYITLLFLDLLCLLVPRRGKKADGEKILVVRLDAVGDFVLWTASLPQLLAPYHVNGDDVSLLGNASWTSVAEGLGYFSDVISLDRVNFLTKFFYRLRLLISIRQARYTTVIVPVYSREALLGDSIVRISGAQNRIGSVGDCTNIGPMLKKLADSWYTRLLPIDKNTDYELQRNADFVSRMWGKPIPLTFPSLPVQASVPDELRGKEYFLLAPGAQVSGKRWPICNFREVIDMIQLKSGMTVVICGASGEEELGAVLTNDGRANAHNYVGRTSLVQLIALIAGAKLVLSNDTSAIHIAVAVSTPAVCVLGGHHYGRFLPYRRIVGDERPLPVTLSHIMPCFQCNWRCTQNRTAISPFPCVSSVTPDEMLFAIECILNSNIDTKS